MTTRCPESGSSAGASYPTMGNFIGGSFMTSYGNFCQRLPRSLRSLIIAVAFCAVFACSSQAQENKLAPEKRTQIEVAVSAFMSSTHVPGVSVAVVENGEYEWGSGLVLGGLGYKPPASDKTRYRPATH